MIPSEFIANITLSSQIVEIIPSPGGDFDVRRQAGAQRPLKQHLGGLQPHLIIICSDPQPPNLGRPSQRPHARRAECRDCRQLRNLHDGKRRLDTFGDGELFADRFDRRELDATIAKLPKRQLTGVSRGFDHRAIRFSTLQERKVCAGVKQRGPRSARHRGLRRRARAERAKSSPGMSRRRSSFAAAGGNGSRLGVEV